MLDPEVSGRANERTPVAVFPSEQRSALPATTEWKREDVSRWSLSPAVLLTSAGFWSAVRSRVTKDPGHTVLEHLDAPRIRREEPKTPTRPPEHQVVAIV